MGRIYDEDDDEEDLEDDEDDGEDADDDVDEDADEDDDSEEPEDDDDGELESESASESNGAEASESSVRARRIDTRSDTNPPDSGRARRASARARGPGGMGRPSSGPAVRRAASRTLEPAVTEPAIHMPETELAPDISSWPGTGEAAKLVGRHTSTIKLWRNQGRIRAVQDASNCWRYHPDDLAEAVETPDATDPGAVLASGVAAIVSHGNLAGDRLLTMTTLATDGLKDATVVLSEELKRAYARIRELEVERKELLAQVAATRAEDRKHERLQLKLEQKHELDVTQAKETSTRLQGLLMVLGPIAASIGARLLGNEAAAEAAERVASGAPPASPQPGAPAVSPTPTEDRLVPFEVKAADAMGRLCDAIRKLDRPAFSGLRAMLPEKVAQALDAIVENHDNGTVGKALAVLVQSAQNLSDLQFMALRPIAPADIAVILGELRELFKGNVQDGPG